MTYSVYRDKIAENYTGQYKMGENKNQLIKKAHGTT
jgi:hypothetical protein